MVGRGTSRRAPEVLLVEDNPGDVRLIREALNAVPPVKNIRVVQDGEEALDYLHKRGVYTGAPTPDLMILDLNLPRLDGRELLAALRTDTTLHPLTVVVLTSSNSDQDIRKCYELCANCYIIKPVELEEFMHTVGAIATFWLTLVALPPHPLGPHRRSNS